MNEIKKLIDKYDLNIRGIEEKKNIRIVDTDKGKYVLKKRFSKEDGLYDYLKNKNFDFILEKEQIDEYNVYPFIEEANEENEEKAIDVVYILSILHNKTLFYRNIVLDKVKECYENYNDKIDYLNYYYHDLQDMIEQKVYMSPAEYLLIRNISLIYSALNFSKQKLYEWYQEKIKQKKERVVLLHNRPSLDHILVGNVKRLISWENYSKDSPIYDFLYFYQKNYLDVEMTSLFQIYQSKFQYTYDEYLLFESLVSIPNKIEFTTNNYKDTVNTYDLIKYVEITRNFILKENEKYQKEDKNEFKE